MPRVPSKWASEQVTELYRSSGLSIATVSNLVDEAWVAGMEDAAKLADEGDGKETSTLPALRALSVAIRRIRAAAKEGKR